MAFLKSSPNNPVLIKRLSIDSSSVYRSNKCGKIGLAEYGGNSKSLVYHGRHHQRRRFLERQSGVMVPSCCSSSTSSAEEVGFVGEGEKDGNSGLGKGQFGYLVSELGWKAEVFSGVVYKIRNSPPNRYACLVAEPTDASDSISASGEGLVGVVDVTVLRDEAVLRHLEGAEEYLYVSGIAVLNAFRRRKIATVLLKACDLISIMWGFDYLALRAYEDDSAARKLYTNAGYRVVSGDPPWMTTWIGRKRRILMIKRSTLSKYPL
ncbi:hypothetical protein HHK36_009194 [Tetracentron sinense]|uniref:N-acetyltransferase domain-containing protein n=1 Tax=Tetracentron sinense TaxID=13715 RepID=A0A835DI64_TETSI|nr:hypothetical protein HHK36_009194 [Tetracentron sinense]